MLMPKRTKFRKMHRGRNKGIATRGNSLDHGDFGLQATTMGNINSRQIEAARRVLTHHMRRRGQVWIRIFPDKPITRKPVETRMGGGKGAVDHWVAVIKPGRMLFEISGVPQDMAEEAMRRASHKLSVATRFVSRSEELVVG
jgi:large subunit ribosomal protein L16